MPGGTGEGDNLKKFCLLPFEEWEKGELANGRADEGPLAADISLVNKGLHEAQRVTYL